MELKGQLRAHLALALRSAGSGVSRSLEHSSWIHEALLDRDLGALTINVKLSVVRKLADQARRASVLSTEQASVMTDVPNVLQRGLRLGNRLTREQAKELLAVPDCSGLKGKRVAWSWLF